MLPGRFGSARSGWLGRIRPYLSGGTLMSTSITVRGFVSPGWTMLGQYAAARKFSTWGSFWRSTSFWAEPVNSSSPRKNRTTKAILIRSKVTTALR